MEKQQPDYQCSMPKAWPYNLWMIGVFAVAESPVLTESGYYSRVKLLPVQLVFSNLFIKIVNAIKPCVIEVFVNASLFGFFQSDVECVYAFITLYVSCYFIILPMPFSNLRCGLVAVRYFS